MSAVAVVAVLAMAGGAWLGARLVGRSPNAAITLVRPVAAAASLPVSEPPVAVLTPRPVPPTVPSPPLPTALPAAGSSTALSGQCTPTDVDVHFTTSKTHYSPGETVWLYTWAVNHSGRDCQMPFNSCTDRVVITDAAGATVWDENPPVPVQPCYSKPIPLPAGATSATSGISWSGSAVPGPYQARARWLVEVATSFSIG